MLLIWKRLGFLVPLTWMTLALIFTALDVDKWIPEESAAVLILVLCSATYWFLGLWLKRRDHAHPHLGRHTFFFIPIEYWAPISFAFAVYLYWFPGQ